MTDLSYGHRFASRRMAENYQFRPPYSPEVYSILLGLIAPQCRTVLDAGCGPERLRWGWHSRATWSEDHLGAEASREFDAGMTKLLSRYAVAGMLEFAVQTRIEWGRVRT
jgi:hypothetical protein